MLTFRVVGKRSMHANEVRPRRNKRGVDLISDALPFDTALFRRSNS